MAATSNGRDITGEVVRSVARSVRRDPADLAMGTRFFEDLDFDSMAVLELLMALEVDLDTEFDAETLGPAAFQTVGTLVAFVSSHLES